MRALPSQSREHGVAQRHDVTRRHTVVGAHREEGDAAADQEGERQPNAGGRCREPDELIGPAPIIPPTPMAVAPGTPIVPFFDGAALPLALVFSRTTQILLQQ